jgi:sulfur-carrier protein adenylyltransferase/sulfurtransferase
MALSIKEIDVKQLEVWKSSNTPHQLIDIREAEEVENCSIGGMHIPMDEILDRASELRKDVPIVIHCRSGKRAAAVVYALEHKLGLTNVYTLNGGILAWGENIDPSMSC